MTSLLNRTLENVRKSRDGDPSGKSRAGQANNDTWKHDLFEADRHTKPLATPIETPDSENHLDEIVDGRSTSLLITNLHYDVSEAELEALFSQIGKIDRGPFIKFDHSGRASEGLAFVSYANESHAEAALEAFNGASAKGQPIGVEYAFTIPPWVRSALGLGRNTPLNGISPTFGLLGRVQHDRSTARNHFSPYDSNRPRGPRASYPPGRARGSTSGRDYRRPHDSSRSSHRARGGPSVRGRAPVRGENGKVKSARDLDKELEAFMGSTAGAAHASHPEADVQMAE